METNPKLQYLRDMIEADKVGIDIVSSLQVLEDLQTSQILQLCIQLARQFLPLYAYHVAESKWVSIALNIMQREQPVAEDMAFPYPFKEYPESSRGDDIVSALYEYQDGMVFLSIAVDFQNDFQTVVRKASISIGDFVSAIMLEFRGTRYPHMQKSLLDENGIEQFWFPKVPEVSLYRKHVWSNIADEIESFLLKNKK